ncbi:RSPH1, partial [Symbiodinium pilosum]
STCMRDWARTDDAEQPLVKLVPLLCPGTANSTAQVSIERVGTNGQDSAEPADSNMELPVNADPQIFFQQGHNSSSSRSRWSGKGDTTNVPPVPNWFQVYDKNKAPLPKESPRFDEVSTMATPREQVGGEFRTPGPTPRKDFKARESPLAPALDEGRREGEMHYEGTYLGTMKHGRGRLRMPNYVYEGEFQNDLKHGIGILSWDDGRRYEGGFQQGQFHGAAVMQWPDGRRYIGQYSEDRKHGEGTFSWQDGRRYEGQWVAGKRHGVGTYTNAKGFTRRGTWQQDRPIKWEEPTEQSVAMPIKLSEQGPSRQLETLAAEEEVLEVSTL